MILSWYRNIKSYHVLSCSRLYIELDKAYWFNDFRLLATTKLKLNDTGNNISMLLLTSSLLISSVIKKEEDMTRKCSCLIPKMWTLKV